jgi:hypothetical protein
MDPFKPYQSSQRVSSQKLSAEDAEAIALNALAYIAGEDELMVNFINLTGCGSFDEIRSRLNDRSFLASSLDFILGNEQATIAFAESIAIGPDVPMLARNRLLRSDRP